MKRFIPLMLLIPVLIGVIILSGCERVGIIIGSGNVITKQYNFSDFTSVEVSSAFQVEITSSNTYSIAITTNENVFDYIDISKSGKTLKIRLKMGSYSNVSVKAVITMPELDGLNLSGASKGSAKGFKSSHDFDLTISGASGLDMEIEAGNTKSDVSGASKITGNLKALDMQLKLSGASQATLNGSANNIKLDASGASHANFNSLTLTNASIVLSGASSATINMSGRLDANLSGASTLEYSGNPMLGTLNITGASNIKHK